MAKERLVVNGYTVPGGFSGIAVRRACETVLANPGVTQKDLLEEAVRYSSLNLGTAGWITSPGPKSPATLLWDRQKEKVFKCYPNEHTEKVVGAEAALFDEIMNQTRLNLRGLRYLPKVGDLVRCYNPVSHRGYAEGLFIGYSLTRGTPTPALYNTIEEIIEARPPCKIGDQIFMDIIQNGTGRRIWEWRFGNVELV